MEKYFSEEQPETTLMFYDNSNRLTRVEYMERKEEYFYDSDNNVIKVNYIGFGNNIERRQVLTYKNLLLIESIITDGDGVSDFVKYEYEFYR